MWSYFIFLIVCAFTIDLDLDEHGCIGLVGYEWCKTLDECVQPWKTPCLTDSFQNSAVRCPCPAIECFENQYIELLPNTETNCCGGIYQCIDCSPTDCPQEPNTCPDGEEIYTPPTSCCAICLPSLALAPGPVLVESSPQESEPCQPVMCMLYCENGFSHNENGCDVCSCCECEAVVCYGHQRRSLIPGTETNCCGGSYECIDVDEGDILTDPCACPLVFCLSDQFAKLIPGTEGNCCGGTYECVSCSNTKCEQATCSTDEEIECCATCAGEPYPSPPQPKPEECSQVMCMMYCEFGFSQGKNGCPICACNSAPEEIGKPTESIISNANQKRVQTSHITEKQKALSGTQVLIILLTMIFLMLFAFLAFFTYRKRKRTHTVVPRNSSFNSWKLENEAPLGLQNFS